LESTKDFAETRINQLRKAFKEITAIPKTDTVIFAGDLNLRDKEVEKRKSLLFDRFMSTNLI
jgi:hypothetical protein